MARLKVGYFNLTKSCKLWHQIKCFSTQFEGKTYPTIVDLCACYQAQPGNVMERLSQGKTLYEAVYRPVKNNGRVNEMVFDGRVYQNAAVLCREYSISRTLVAGQQRYAKGKSFLDCFRLVKQLRDECG